jgi:hypothetical protein
MHDQVKGYSKLTRALLTKWSMDVCEDMRMIRDSDSANWMEEISVNRGTKSKRRLEPHLE